MDLTDEQWQVLQPLIPEPPRREDGRGRPWRNPRGVLNGIPFGYFAPRRSLEGPPRALPALPETCHRRFQRWVEEGVLWRILEVLAERPNKSVGI